MDKKSTAQTKAWESEFGKDYTDRNPLSINDVERLYLKEYGITRAELNRTFLGEIDRSLKILEVGSNVGMQLACLQEMGFKSLYGIELQDYAVEQSKQTTKNINIIQGSAFDIPFKDDYFDLVFTSGVLIHISPSDIGKALGEIHRCARGYIWGFEYFAKEYTEIPYRGQKNLLWKTNFTKLYLDQFKDLELVKERHVKYLKSDNVDIMFLLRKKHA